MSTWKIDPAHTDVNFSAKHMMVTTVHGKFATVEGTIDLDDAEPQRSQGEFRVATASITTGNEA
ncbi:MAG TPA: YceI family protein, partial [Candidatus Saccharimonadales bacterium]|nr:YceI family protein [Candidatus Saccharimonadales bacterium]